MSEDNGVNVVFGASGSLGSAVVRLLAADGNRVRAVNRSGLSEVPEGVEVIQVDASDLESVRNACHGATVVYHCANAPYNKWPVMILPIMHGIIAGAASAGAKLIYGDNLYMYGPVSKPLTEDLPYAATGIKGRIRAQTAEYLMEQYRSGKVRVAIGRASDFFGPFSSSMTGDLIFRPALAGKAARALGNIDVPHTWTFTEDFARGLITLAEKEEALGQVWHVPSAETITTRRLIEMIYEEAGTHDRMKIKTVGNVIISIMGLFNPIIRELKEMMYEWNEPYIVDHSKYEKAFGNHSTPHREAIRKTLDWFRRNPA